MNSLSYARAMGALCVCTMVIILVAGLWPFHAPKNDVTWLAKEDGLRFGDHGTILSSSAFKSDGPTNNSSGSLEIWLEPARSKEKNTILAFEGSGHTEASFSLQQRGDTLIVQRRNTDDKGNCRIAEFAIEGVFPEKKRLFVTITLGPHTSSVYLDGVLVRASEILGRAPGSLTGRLVLGNSLTTSDSWSGQISGLAIYEHEMTAARVFEHYEESTKNHRPLLTQDNQPAALYLFSEREGNVVHNQLGPSTDLIIPVRYLVLHSAFLSLPWHGYHTTWSYWADVGLNIAGFIPFGFFFVAYFSTVCATRNAAATTILLGFLTSFTIELLQAYLPTRDSGMNDLITNTLGTALGVLLYCCSWVQRLMVQLLAKQQLVLRACTSMEVGNAISS